MMALQTDGSVRLSTGTQKGDVYSFGIIMHEILYRAGIFCYTEENETIAAKSESMSTIETTVLLGLTVAVWFSLPDTNKD